MTHCEKGDLGRPGEREGSKESVMVRGQEGGWHGPKECLWRHPFERPDRSAILAIGASASVALR